ncbi:MAG: YfcE family phosphodiesterase [bacterium]|nr:YfcE family phosphodiesterase [bacterium]
MKLGILSDIHADLERLKEVLDRFEQVHRVDQIVIAGDLVGRGQYPNETLALVRERGFLAVRGNHERVYEDDPSLTAENREYLKALSFDWRGVIGGVRIFLTHGKPGSRGAPGNPKWGLWRDHVSNTYLDMMLRDLSVDVLITGHTHIPLFARVPHGCVINPGSLCGFFPPRETSHTYGVLDLGELAFSVYDISCPPSASQVLSA